jgi:5-(carboxyamino)imidazole ribonucleotide synthase
MARDPAAKVHMYGKGVRPGRKIGHVNVSGSDLADARERARHAADYLQGAITQ